jgi:hypothetical protein
MRIASPQNRPTENDVVCDDCHRVERTTDVAVDVDFRLIVGWQISRKLLAISLQ